MCDGLGLCEAKCTQYTISYIYLRSTKLGKAKLVPHRFKMKVARTSYSNTYH